MARCALKSFVAQVLSKVEFRGRPKGARDSRPRKRPTQREQDPAWQPSLIRVLLAAPDYAATCAPGAAAGPDAPSPTHNCQPPAPDLPGEDRDSGTCHQLETHAAHCPGPSESGSAIDFLWSVACSQAAGAAGFDGADLGSEFPGRLTPAADAAGADAGPLPAAGDGGGPGPPGLGDDAWAAAAADDELDPFGWICDSEPW